MFIENTDIDEIYSEFYLRPKDKREFKLNSFLKDDANMVFESDHSREMDNPNIFEIMKKNSNLIKCMSCGTSVKSRDDLQRCEFCDRKCCEDCWSKCESCGTPVCHDCSRVINSKSFNNHQITTIMTFKNQRMKVCPNCIE